MEADLIAAAGRVYSELYGIANALMIRIMNPIEVCGAFLLLELVFPRTRNSMRSYVIGAAFLATTILINTLILTVSYEMTGASGTPGAGTIKPLTVLDIRPWTESSYLGLRIAGWIVAAFAISLIANFFYYWFHRAQHAVPALWRFHSIHHSITELSATNGYHHFTEDFFQFIAIVLPMSFLFGQETGPVPHIILFVAATQAYFIHSSTKVGIGPLRYIIGDNRFHRLHHSLEQRHFGKNFGTATPLWDVLFGTAYFPAKDEWPAVGLADTAPPATVGEYLWRPFRSRELVAAR